MKYTTLFAGAIFSLLSVNAAAYTIDDAYIGGQDSLNRDVIGRADWFDTFGANVAIDGTTITVDIHTNFVNGIGSYPSATYDNNGIGVGDLFLATEWNPYGSASDGYSADNHATGTLWSYGLAIDNPFSQTGGSASLYALNGATNNANAILSDDYLSVGNGSYRNGQEISVDQSSGSTVDTGIGGSWSVNKTDNIISFMFDAAGTDLFSTGELALHWGPFCGNDTIEGVVSVDEPTTLVLFGLGVFGLVIARRKNSANNLLV